MINEINKPWTPVFGSGVPQTPSGGGGGGVWTLISNTAAAAAAVLDITDITGHTHYCAMLRGLRASAAFAGTLDMRISDDNGSTFKSTSDYEGRKNQKYSGGTGEGDTAYTTDSSFSLIDGGVNEISDVAAAGGIFGKIWLWEPGLADVKEFLMEFHLEYLNESGRIAETKGFGLYPSFTNGLDPIDAFQLFTGLNFAAAGSIDLYGIT